MNKLLLVLVLPFMMVSCSTKPSRLVIPPQPKQEESALPTLRKGNADVDIAVKENTQLKSELNRAYGELHDQKVAINTAIDKVNELKSLLDSKEEINALTIDDLISVLNQIKTRNLFLEKNNSDLININNKQEETLARIKSSLDIAEKKVIDKEAETNSLRTQNNYYHTVISNQQDQISDLNSNIDNANEKLASAKVYKHWVIGLVIAIVAWFLVKKALLVYMPPIGRRLW